MEALATSRFSAAAIEKQHGRFRGGLFLVTAAFLFTSAVSVRADYTAVVNPGSVLVTNFQGWGSSLSWWANVIGGYSNRTNYADLAFSQLKLNIVRYNIGGGENPSISNSLSYRSSIPGFEPSNGSWNWNADLNQRWVLQAAHARGANLVMAFANSPPWWMTVSGSVTGAVGGTNNLQPAYEVPFAAYIATVVSNLTVRDGDHFDYVTPMNEPSLGWAYLKQTQEGCHMTADQQSRVINDLRTALNTNAPSSGIDAPSDYDEFESYNDLTAYSAGTLANLALCSTHTYKANDAANLKNKAAALQKSLWVSEYGDNDGTGLTMAQRIHDDITGMGVRAWVYWQFVDSAGGWGFLYNPLVAPTSGNYTVNYTINQKFYAMGQFSEFVRPGCKIIAVNDANTLAAYTSNNSTLTLVTVNTNSSGFNVTYDLSSFGPLAWQASVSQTAPAENMAALPPPIVANQKFTFAIPSRSVTTFVLTTNLYAPSITSRFPQPNAGVINLYAGQTPALSISVTGSIPLYYRWLSNGVAVAGATNANFTPPPLPPNSLVPFSCIVTNIAGAATSMVWNVSIVPPPTAAYPKSVLALNPIGYWRLNEADQGNGDNGITAADSAGGNDGLYTNTVLGQPGYSATTEPNGTSALFGFILSTDCAVGRIESPDFTTPPGSNAEFAVAAWVNGTGYPRHMNAGIVDKGYFWGEELDLDEGAPGADLRFVVRNAAGTAYTANSSINLYANSGWHHVVGVCDEANNKLLLYVDGAPAGSSTIPALSGITNSASVPMTIGARATSAISGNNQQFFGWISDVAIFNYALNSNQVQTIYQAGVSLPPVGLTISATSSNTATLNWNYGTLQSATNAAGPYSDMSNAIQPFVLSITNSQQFYRVKEN
jgi:O-glycosyl hydrolase